MMMVGLKNYIASFTAGSYKTGAMSQNTESGKDQTVMWWKSIKKVQYMISGSSGGDMTDLHQRTCRAAITHNKED